MKIRKFNESVTDDIHPDNIVMMKITPSKKSKFLREFSNKEVIICFGEGNGEGGEVLSIQLASGYGDDYIDETYDTFDEYLNDVHNGDESTFYNDVFYDLSRENRAQYNDIKEWFQKNNKIVICVYVSK